MSGVEASSVWLNIVDKYKNSVVQLICIKGSYNPFRPQNLPNDRKVSGSGFIVDILNGIILTNAHVVQNSISISGRIDRFGERDLGLKLISICREKDIALCQLSKDDISLILNDKTPEQINMTFGDSFSIKETDEVIALGFPLGYRGVKATTGIVSGFHANTTGDEDDEITLTEEESPSYIQISAALNGGNSGGPLLNQKGQVIGINAAGILFSQNVGFTIPSRTVIGIYDELYRPLRDSSLKTPHVVITPKYAFEYNRSSTALLELACKQSEVEGIYVKRVYPNSCFDNLKDGDIIAQILYHDIYYNNPSAFNVLNRQSYQGTLVTANLDKFGDITLDLPCPNTGNSSQTCRKISIKELFDMIPIGHEITIHICRSSDDSCDPDQGTSGIYAIKTRFIYVPSKIRDPIYPRINPFKYEIVAGLSIGELTINHIDRNDSLIEYSKGKKRYEPFLVVNQIFADTSAYHIRVFTEGSIIKKVNGIKVSTIEQLRQVLLQSKDYLIFTGKQHDKFAVKKSDAIREDLFALEQFGLTNHKYIFADIITAESSHSVSK